MNTDPELKLFVSNIDPAWDEQKIRDLFETYGDLISISQFTDQGRSNLHVDLGCAYVKFAHKSQAEEAAKRIQQNANLKIRWADAELERLENLKQASPVIQATPAVNNTELTYVEYTSSDGRPYYWNSATGSTQWEKPENANVIKNPQGNLSQRRIGNTLSQGPPGCNLFIFHLPIEWTETDLINFFAPFGSVISARIMLDKTTGLSRGFGFLSYDNAVCAMNAMTTLNGYQVMGKRLKVQLKKGEF